MALTRARLRELGVTDKEVLDEIMESHGTGVEAAKEKAKEDAEKAAKIKIDALQEKIDSIPEPPSDGEDWKAKYETLSTSAVDESGKTYKELHTALKGDFDTYKSTVETEKTERETDEKIIAVQSKHKYANDRTGKSLFEDMKKILKDPENKKSVEEIHTELTMDKDGKPIPGIFAKAPDMPPSGNAGGDNDSPKTMYEALTQKYTK